MESTRPAFEVESVESLLEVILKTAGVSEGELLPHLDLRSLIHLTQTNRNIHGLLENGHCKKVLSNAIMAHLASILRLSQTDRGTHGLFENIDSKKSLLDALMNYLANIIVNEPTGKNISILILLLTNMVSSYPELLTRKVPKVVFKETGQVYIDYSLLELAFAEYDDELCCDAFEPLFERAFGSKEAARVEIRKQLDEKFPEESEEETKKRKAEEKKLLLALLAPVKQAITSEQFNNGRDADAKLILNPATHTPINPARKAFDALQPKEIHKGRRSSLNAAQIIYDDLAEADQQWQYNYNRYALYDDIFVSYTQRYWPKNVASGGAQGFYYLQDRSEIFERDTTLRSDATTSRGDNVEGPRINFYDCLKRPSLDFSGLEGASVNIVFGAARGADVGWWGRLGEARFFKTLVEQKHQTCRTYAARQKESCVPANSLLK